MAKREEMGTTLDRSFVQRVADGARYIVSGVKPESWFGPAQPLAPVAQERTEGRAFDYPVGFNLRTQPRSEESVSFAQLRGLADGYDLLRLAVETRKDQMEMFEWEVVPRDKEKSADALKKQISEATRLLERPDRENDWPEWLRIALEDLLVIDTICVYPRMNKGGKFYGLELVDGATIKRLLDEDGRTPMAPSPAYQQVLKGIPAADYTTEELKYMVRNKRTWKVYGYSPVEQVIMTVNIALRRQVHQLQFYTEGNIPEAIAQLPKDWPMQQVTDFQMWWDSLMEGNTAQRRKMRFIPNLEGIQFPKAGVIKDEYDEWLARVICYAFSLPPTAFVKQQNRATAEQSADSAKEEGLLPLLNWTRTKMSALLQGPMGYPDLAFRWKLDNKIAPGMQADIHTKYIQNKVLTPDEVREDLGKDALTDEQKEAAWPAPPPMPEINGTGELAPGETKDGVPPPADNKAAVPPKKEDDAVAKFIADLEELAKGDLPGHEFHGNQHVDAGGGSGSKDAAPKEWKREGKSVLTAKQAKKLTIQDASSALRAHGFSIDFSAGTKMSPDFRASYSVKDKDGNATWRTAAEIKDFLTKGIAVHLHKAERRETAVGRYVKAKQPALQRKVAEVLRIQALYVAKRLRAMDKADRATIELVDSLMADIDLDGVGVAVVEQLSPEMRKAFKAAGLRGLLQVNVDADVDIVKHLDAKALGYAEQRAAELVKGINDTTREELRTLLSKGVEDGMSPAKLADSIEDMGTFGESRALMIARTELAFAHVQGNVQGWRESGEEVMKKSILGDLHDIEDECDECADAGTVGMDDEFIPGYSFPPYHPRCVCDIVPVLKQPEGENE